MVKWPSSRRLHACQCPMVNHLMFDNTGQSFLQSQPIYETCVTLFFFGVIFTTLHNFKLQEDKSISIFQRI